MHVLQTYRLRDQTVSQAEHSRPVQHHAPWEMPTDLDSRDARQNFLNATFDQSSPTVCVFPICPFCVFSGNVHRTIKRIGPLKVRRVVMWVRDHNRLHGAVRFYG